MIHKRDIESYRLDEIKNLKKREWKKVGTTGLYSDKDKSYFIIHLVKTLTIQSTKK